MIKKSFILRLIALLLVAVNIFSLTSCEFGGDSEYETKLSFKQALSYDYLKDLDGKTVTINGYLATSSPVDGSFIFLMNMPFQSCPFCVPNTSQLSNTMEVYPKDGKSFTYTNQAVKVTGKLEVADDPDKPFTDRFGYQFSFKIVDAAYTILKDSDLSAEMALWQKFSATNIIDEINRMYDYVNFLCAWNTYFVNNWTDENGVVQKGFYLYASDAIQYIKGENAQYSYGYKDGYFEDIISKIKKIDENVFSDLVKNIETAKQLASEALAELEAGNYTSEYKYVEKFDQNDYIYTLNRGEELTSRMDTLYSDFANWLAGWEM